MNHHIANLRLVDAQLMVTYLLNNGFNFEVSCNVSAVSIWGSEKAIRELREHFPDING